MPLNRGPALVTKTLWTHFPDELVLINSSANLRHFLRVVGADDVASEQSLGTIALNRALLTRLRQLPALQTVSTKALERLRYTRFSPFAGRLVKIAPGEEARFWQDCLAGGDICACVRAAPPCGRS